MIELVYLNPNISKEDAGELVGEGVRIRERLFEKLISNMETLGSPKKQSEYLSSCLPFLMMI